MTIGHTPENCKKIANKIIDGLTLKDLAPIVYDELYDNLLSDEIHFLFIVETANIYTQEELDKCLK